MRHGIIFLLGLLFATVLVRADESFATLKVGNVVYTNVTVTSVNAKNISFTYAQGMASVKLKDLDPAMQKHFHYDGAKETAGEQQQGEISALVTKLSAEGADVRLPSGVDANAVREQVFERVKEIVNKPVPSLPRSPDMKSVGFFNNGWFHPGADKPDFNTVDVRQTQDVSPYLGFEYVTSDLNPGVVFPAKDVAFNSMTKYFYTDRSVPKRKLTDAEMLQINQLYRIIAQCEKRLNGTEDTSPQVTAAASYLAKNRPMIIGIAAGLIVLLLIVRMATKRA